MGTDSDSTESSDECQGAYDLQELVTTDGAGGRTWAQWFGPSGVTYLQLDTPEVSASESIAMALDAEDAAYWRGSFDSYDSCHITGTSGTIEVTGTLSDCTDTAQTGCLVGSLSFDWQDVVFEEGAWLDGVLTAVYDVGPDE